MDITFYSLELPEGIVVVKKETIHSYISYSQQPQFAYACLNKKARLYKLVNPLPEYKDHAYAWCDDDECILFKEFPSAEQLPVLHAHTLKIPYESVHRTINPVEADLFWKENQTSNERESRILHGLAAIQEAWRAIDYSEQILSAHTTIVYNNPTASAPVSEAKQKPQTRISKLMIADAVQSAATCPITTNPLTLTNAACVAPCYHIFEREAITKWLSSKNTCPECRQPCCL